MKWDVMCDGRRRWLGSLRTAPGGRRHQAWASALTRTRSAHEESNREINEKENDVPHSAPEGFLRRVYNLKQVSLG